MSRLPETPEHVAAFTPRDCPRPAPSRCGAVLNPASVEPVRSAGGDFFGVEIVLPWPSANLSPNVRVHWAARAKAAKKLRALAHQEALAAGLRPRGYPYAVLRVTWHPPTRLRRDLDNLIGRFKSAQDGIADAIATDDVTFKVTHERGDVRAGGAVRVIVELPA